MFSGINGAYCNISERLLYLKPYHVIIAIKKHNIQEF